tara:strand:+ start:347 stop:745 length:399 start_codon:yes stop_codon:yes gene_type:complete
MPKKSIVSRRRYIPPSIKEKTTNKNITGVIKNYVHANVSTASSTTQAIATAQQPSSVVIANTSDTVSCFISVAVAIPSTVIQLYTKVKIPVGAALKLDSDDIPINPSEKGLQFTLERDGSVGDASVSIVITF